MASGRPRKNGTAKAAPKSAQSATLAFAPTLWAAADKLRGNMDAAEYKHVALGLIFLKYISDRSDERRAEILADKDTPENLREELAEESVRAKMRIEVRKALARYGYPPDLQKAAVDLVLKQAEALAGSWS